MASLQLRGKSYACISCWRGKRKWFTIGKVAGAGALDHREKPFLCDDFDVAAGHEH